MFTQTLNDTNTVQLPYSKEIDSTLLNYGPADVLLHEDIPVTASNSIHVPQYSSFLMPANKVYFATTESPPVTIGVAEGRQYFNPVPPAPLEYPPIRFTLYDTSINEPIDPLSISPGIITATPYPSDVNIGSQLPYMYNNLYVILGGSLYNYTSDNIPFSSDLVLYLDCLHFSAMLPLYYNVRTETGAFTVPRIVFPIFAQKTLGSTSNDPSKYLYYMDIINNSSYTFNASEMFVYGTQSDNTPNFWSIDNELIYFTSSTPLTTNEYMGVSSHLIKPSTFDVIIEDSGGNDYTVGATSIYTDDFSSSANTIQCVPPSGTLPSSVPMYQPRRVLSTGTTSSTGQTVISNLTCSYETIYVMISNPNTSTTTVSSIKAYATT